MTPDANQTSGIRPQLMYLIMFPLLRALLSVRYRFTYEGVENVPAAGPLIMAGNHTSNLDPFSIAFVLPVSRPIAFMAKAEMFRNPVSGWFFRSVHQFPVNRGAADREALRFALDILKRGGVLGIFPQGTRSAGGAVTEAQSGAAFMALHSGAPVVPCGIVHSRAGFGRITVLVRYGAPIDPADFAELPKRERNDAFTARLVQGINAALAGHDEGSHA